jgi:hypothetical protein
VDLADSGARATLRCAAWRKSRYSNPSGDCVEFARLPARTVASTAASTVASTVASTAAGSVAVRDSKHPGGGVLVFTSVQWEAFLTGVRTGETG